MLAAVAGMLQAGGASVRDRIDICEKGTRRGRTTGVDESVSAILAPWSGRRRQQTRPHGGLYLMGIRCSCGAAGGFRHRHFPLFIVLERGKRLLGRQWVVLECGLTQWCQQRMPRVALASPSSPNSYFWYIIERIITFVIPL